MHSVVVGNNPPPAPPPARRRACMTHQSVPEETRLALGISDTLVRLSVGIEDAADLVADLLNALKAAEAAAPS